MLVQDMVTGTGTKGIREHLHPSKGQRGIAATRTMYHTTGTAGNDVTEVMVLRAVDPVNDNQVG